MSRSAAFKLSRIYAEGWNAAMQLFADESAQLGSAGIAALNPYSIEPERSRWSEGFTKAFGKEQSAGSPQAGLR